MHINMHVICVLIYKLHKYVLVKIYKVKEKDR